VSWETGHKCLGDLLRNCPYALWLDNTEVEEQTVVLEVVCDDDAALLLPCQHILHVVFYVTTIFNKSGINVAIGEIDNVETVLKVADYAHNFVVLFLLLIDRYKLCNAERRYIEPFAREGIEIVQTVGILLEPNIATIATHEDIGIHEDAV